MQTPTTIDRGYSVALFGTLFLLLFLQGWSIKLGLEQTSYLEQISQTPEEPMKRRTSFTVYDPNGNPQSDQVETVFQEPPHQTETRLEWHARHRETVQEAIEDWESDGYTRAAPAPPAGS